MSVSLKAKIAEVFEEPGCDKNQGKTEKERKKGCTKQLNPGAAAGGCAFDGAKIALQPVVDVAHLVHGPIACEGNSWDNRHSASSGSQLYRTGFTTDINELDVIYGGEKRLFKSIREIIEKYDPPAVFVYQTCVTALVGDDIEAVCQRATEKFGKPIIPVNAPGFAGPKNLGNKLGAEALLDYVIGTVEPEFTTPYDINIIGEYNLVGELWQVKPLLDALGIRILSCISGDGRYNEVASAHRAKVNMMVCSKSMINIATKMEQRWGIPYFEGSFYGIGDMSDTLRQIATLLVKQGAPAELMERTERLIAVEEARAWERIAHYKTRLTGKRALLITGGVKSWSVVAALQEAGIEIAGTSVKKIHQGRQGKDQGNHGRRRPHDRRHDAARDVQHAARRTRRHHAVGRPLAVRRAQGAHALAGHQPGAPSPLRRLRRHGRAGARNRPGDLQPGLAAGAHSRALGRRRRNPGRRADGGHPRSSGAGHGFSGRHRCQGDGPGARRNSGLTQPLPRAIHHGQRC